jgi:hypothetical protein
MLVVWEKVDFMVDLRLAITYRDVKTIVIASEQ